MRHVIRLAAGTAVGWPLLFAACTAPRPKADWVHFPPPPATTRVVHLKSFNSLHDLVPPRWTFADLIAGQPPGPFVARPAGISTHGTRLLICDPGLGVLHDWNLTTGTARRFERAGTRRLIKPVDVTVTDSGDIFVADTGLGGVVQFAPGNAEGQLLPAPVDGSFRPVGLATFQGKLFVAGIEPPAIHVFNLGSHEWDHEPDALQGHPALLPMGMTTDGRGRLLACDMMGSRLFVFGPSGALEQTIGRPGDRYGDLGRPRDVAVSDHGLRFIADAEFAHVHLFDDQGRLLMLLGGPEDKTGGTPLPVAVAWTSAISPGVRNWLPPDFEASGLLFVANTIGDKRLNLFAIGKDSRPHGQADSAGNAD